jgi:CRP/FNR family transcriptional regulator, cyclic AMP receptor protein
MARRDADLLAKVPLFAGLPKRHLKAVAGIATEEDFPEKATIAKEGTPGEDFYVIVEGQASVLRGGRRVSRLLPGDFFGEIALLDEGPRTASVVAETPLSALTINRKPFTTLLEREPSIVLKMLEALATRLRNQERSLTG